jgi:hypothetical protein
MGPTAVAYKRHRETDLTHHPQLEKCSYYPKIQLFVLSTSLDFVPQVETYRRQLNYGRLVGEQVCLRVSMAAPVRAASWVTLTGKD